MKNIRSNSIYRRTNRSMQYYRLWIYSCNGVLGITSAIFAIFAAFVLADVRLSLLGGVELYHPTFLYAYTALILQCGVVQTIGCLGAQRLSHKLLSVYWILLLLLTIGDVVVGLVWVFKLDKVKLNLRPVLTSEFISKYSTDESFTKTWNKVQSEEHCCGVDGPLDYDKLSRVAHQQHSKLNPNSSLVIDVESSLLSLPESCCIVIYDSALVGGGSGSRDSVNQTHRSPHHSHAKELPNPPHDRAHLQVHDGSGRGGNHGGGASNVSDIPPPASSFLPWDSEGSGGGTADDDNFMLSDAPHHNVNVNPQSQISSPLLLPEESSGGHDEVLVGSSSHAESSTSGGGGEDETSRESNQQDGISLGSESSEESPLALPLQASLNKHKHRHETHRWKQPSPSNSSGEAALRRPSLGNDTGGSAEVSESEISSPSSKNGSNERRNKSKSLPSFSLTPKRLPQSSSSTRKVPPVVVTEETEVAERLPVPFTCQRHLKIQYHPTQPAPPRSNDDDDAGAAQKGGDSRSTSTISWTSPFLSSRDQRPPPPPPSSTIPSPLSSPSYPSLLVSSDRSQQSRRSSPTTQETNEIDEQQSLEDSDGGNRSKVKEETETGAAVAVGGGSPSGKRNKRNVDMVGLKFSNPFSFLHASAFGLEGNLGGGERQRNSMRRIKRGSEIGSDMQAAYYLSSSYLSRNALNSSLERKFQVYRHGCGVKLIQWVDHVSGILFILGFCIIGFVKACFLIILRTEIREMIEKIQLLEIDDPVSPSRAQLKDQRLSHVSHPLLTHPLHRASTVSAHAHNASLLPTIKSPEGVSSQPTRFPRSYHQRRHSNIVGDRSQTHSQETVNMTLMVSSNSQAGSPGGGGRPPSQITADGGPQQTEKGRSNPNLSFGSGAVGVGGGGIGGGMGFMGFGRGDEFDPTGLCISVPNTSRYLRRSSTSCSSSAYQGPSYSLFSHYESESNKAGPSSRFYHYEPHHHPPLYHSHCLHHHSRARPHLRNISTGAVVHQSSVTRMDGSSGGPGPSSGISSAFRSFGGESGSLSSRDENEILSASMENVGGSGDKSEDERRDAEIRDWAAATACTDTTTTTTTGGGGAASGGEGGGGGDGGGTALMSLGDFTKAGFNLSVDSTESERNGGGSKRNGNNNMEPPDSIPLSYLGTAV